MKFVEFETKNELLSRTTGIIESMSSGAVYWSSMILHAPDNSPELQFIEALSAAQQRSVDTHLYLDEDYNNRMTISGNRHIPRGFPRLTSSERKLTYENECTQNSNQENFSSLLLPTPKLFQIKTDANWPRRLASQHLLQKLAPFHPKVGVLENVDAQQNLVTIGTGNLQYTPDMLDFALTIDSAKAASVVKNILSGNVNSSGYAEASLDDNIRLVCDYSNLGQPGRLPRLNDIAHQLINPSYDTKGTPSKRKPSSIIFMSQYLPDGQLANALALAKQNGAEVTIPLQPVNDHRRRAMGYHAWTSLHHKKLEAAGISLPERSQVSHNKCLLVHYDDSTKAMIFGSDNFMTTMQKFVRTPEISIVIDPVGAGEPGREIIDRAYEVLRGIDFPEETQ